MSDDQLRPEYVVRSTALFVATAMLIKRVDDIRAATGRNGAFAELGVELASLRARAGDYRDWLERASSDELVTDAERAALRADSLVSTAPAEGR